MRWKAFCFPAIVALTALLPAAVRAGCGSATCPLHHDHAIGAGVLRLAYVREYIDQDRIFVGSSRSPVGAIPGRHDEVRTVNEREILQFSAGLSARSALAVELPFVRRQHSHIHHEGDWEAWESWNVSGLGDLRVTGEYALAGPSDPSAALVSVLAGVKLPTGVTGATNAEGEPAEVPIQPGTGSTDGIVGIRYRQSVGSVPALVGGSYASLPLTAGVEYQRGGRGSDGWRTGAAVTAHAGASYAWSQAARVLFQFDAKIQDFADVGETGEPRENTGGTWIYASPGMAVDLLESVSAYGYLQLPVYQKVHGIQQTAPLNLQFGISADVELGGE